MRDRLTKERRSWNMSRIRGKNTSPEMAVRRLLHRMGYRFRLHVRIPFPPNRPRPRSRPSSSTASSSSHPLTVSRSLRHLRFIRPDIVLPKYKTVIFVHGCFWHRHRGCKNCTTPTNRREWWVAKLEGNATRDTFHRKALRKLGWRVIVVWECHTESPKKLRYVAERFCRIS